MDRAYLAGMAPITTCNALNCCEPRATVSAEFCERHSRDLTLFGLWLHSTMPIVRPGGVMGIAEADNRCSFDVARSQWAEAVNSPRH